MTLLLRQLIPLVVMLAVLSALSESSWSAPTAAELAKADKEAEKASKAAEKAAQKAAKAAEKAAKAEEKAAQKAAKEAAKNPSGASFSYAGSLGGSVTIWAGGNDFFYGPGSGPTLASVLLGTGSNLSYLAIPTTLASGHILVLPGGGSLILQDGARLSSENSLTTLYDSSTSIIGSGSILLPNGETIPFSEDGTLLLPTGQSVNIPIGETWILSGDGTLVAQSEEAI